MESRPSDAPLRLQRSAPPPGHRLHPRYGESAIQISSQCDARTNEFPDFKASGTAKCLPVISTQNADCADLTVVPMAGADRLSSGGCRLCLVGTTWVVGADASSIG